MQKGDINKEPMDINELAQDVLASAQLDGCDGFDSVLDLGHDLPMVLANRIQVQRILNNLIRNGIEAARASGMPCESIMIRVKTAVEHGMAQVTIQDNGPGIDADMNDEVFKPFFTTKPHGIGMGLAVSDALAKANGGCLWVDQGGSPGATFHLALPFSS
ncbi:sensor protein FixL [mine drainage metagenome]|uniref:Sensor protein FixL n=1 Tax=mine drainage metagenome TaxID=410659 RepID=A0A1J5Q4E1_9ZZZZ